MDGHEAATARRRLSAHVLRVLVALVLLALVSVVPAEARTARVVTAGPRWKHAVALTFDDGIGRHTCARIARTLRLNGAVGTFFINGVHVKQYPYKWRHILKGMPIGNHTFTHPDLRTLSNAAIRRQLRRNERIEEAILGRPMLKLMRPPYGSTDPRVEWIAGQLGYRRTVLWNVDPRDWSGSTSVSSIIARSIGARSGSIILLHCSRWATAQALPAIIRHYRSRGLRLVGLDTLLSL